MDSGRDGGHIPPPMPVLRFIVPCLPSPGDRPPSGSNWIHEIKHDGYRLNASLSELVSALSTHPFKATNRSSSTPTSSASRFTAGASGFLNLASPATGRNGSAIPAASTRSPPAPSCRRVETPSRRRGAPGARSVARRAGSSAGCSPALPCAPRSAPGAGRRRPAPAGRRRRERPRLVPPVAEQLEGSQPALVTAHHLAVDQAGPDLEVVHRLDDQRIAGRPSHGRCGSAAGCPRGRGGPSAGSRRA